MKVYEVRVEKVEADWGRHAGWENVAYTLTEAKADEIAAAKKAEITAKPTWWMTYGAVLNGDPRIEIIELGEVVE